MSKQAFAERCQIAQQLLPYAQYRAMLTALHAEMLMALAEQPDLQAEILEQCRINGMSAEREDALRAEVERLNKAQKREWVGLTFAEICECENDYLHLFARAIEAKLKEKNT
jgi:ParB-like chromosome segregation protein Spo0J